MQRRSRTNDYIKEVRKEMLKKNKQNVPMAFVDYEEALHNINVIYAINKA